MADERAFALYPPIAPYAHGYLSVGDGHEIYWEACGNPRGQAALFLHGGPGGGCSLDHRRLFDPDRYNAILFDQRGAGRSRPHASICANTTAHLVEDMERLRLSLGIERWLLVGGSWGCALGLAYAQRHPSRVRGLLLRGAFCARARELRWLYEDGASHLFPEAWEAFLGFLREDERRDPIRAYHARLGSANESERLRATRAWCAWESAAMTLLPRNRAVELAESYALARIEAHYFVHQAFLEEGELIAGARRLAGVPGVIIQGRYDCVTPPATAWELHQAWPGSVLHMVPDAGHASSEPGIARRLIAALDAFARE